MLQVIKNAPSVIPNLGTRVKLPAKLKGTFVEKWTNYWKNLFIDYRQMLQDLRSDIQDDPRKAMLWSAGLATTYALSKNNPSEIEFKDYIKRIANEIAMVSDNCRNSQAVDHLHTLETRYNEGVLHYRSLGIFSVMYTTDLNDDCDLYKGRCEYLKPSLFSFPSRIVDVGFMGRWWNVYIKTVNYDVNVNDL